jgi:valyl-tRNA synthetase
MENIRDWCISRQLWWGHRIPAFYCKDCGEVTVSREDVTVCPKCGSKHVEQDPDVLDTWFSSALWPFATLGWPKKSPDLDYFYPTDVLVTGYDIIFFWVARMIFSGLEHTGRKPFSTVLIHGLVRDAQGRKMSKSLGNGIDPLEIIEQYGADALRFTLVTGNSPGNDMRFSVERVESSRNFANKIWNATRFALMNLDIEDIALPEKLELEDKWVLSKYNTLVAEVTDNIDRFELGIAAGKLYDFIWDSFCDWYIEIAKSRLNDKENRETCEGAQRVLLYVLANTLKLLHPFMPFLTEAIWQTLPSDDAFIMKANWPEYDEKLSFKSEEADFEVLIQIIRAIRNRRSEMNVPPSKKASMIVVTDRPSFFETCGVFVQRLAFADQITVASDVPADTQGMVVVVSGTTRVFIPLSELVVYAKELERLTREKKKAEEELAKLDAKLANPGFVAKAPEAVISGERQKREKLLETLKSIEESVKLYA